MRVYKNFNIEKLYNGMYETYLERFVKADTLKGIKKMINDYLEMRKNSFKWNYKKTIVQQSENFRIVIETAYYTNYNQNVTFITEQVYNNNDWHNIQTNRIYTNVKED
jgi:hypothetical protein